MSAARTCLISLLVLAAGSAAQDDPLFRTFHLEWPSFTGLSIASGDLAGDGRPDAVVDVNGKLRPLAGRGDGSLVLDPALDVPGLNGGAATEDLRLADLDGDGVLDVIVSGGPALDVCFGNGDLTFDVQLEWIDALGKTRELAAQDLDGDGDVDLAAGNYDGNRVSVHLNEGDGSFAPHTELGLVPQGITVATGDWDVDGDVDLVFGEFDSDGLSLFFNTGAGSFGGAVPVVLGGEIADVAAGDLDEDGAPDLAADVPGAVRVLAGDGEGGFIAVASLVHGFSFDALELEDMDEDGHLDVLLSTFSISVWDGDGRFGFSAPHAVPVGLVATDFTVDDFDRDGEPDIASVDFPNDGVTVALGSHDGGSYPHVPVGPRPSEAVALADFDHDGRLDLVSANAAATLANGCSVSVARGLPQGRFALATEFTMGTTPVAPAGVWAGPLDDDGNPDFVFAPDGFFGGTVVVRRGDGDLGFLPSQVTSAGNDLRDLDAADFDQDGHMDLVLVSNALAQDLVLAGVGDGTFLAPQVIPAWFAPEAVRAGDVNGDGLPDFVVSHTVSQDSIQVHLNAPGPGFQPAIALPVQSFATNLTAADLDLDGDLDLALAGSFGFTDVLMGNGLGGFTQAPNVPVTLGPQDVEAGDLDHDGLPDLLYALQGNFGDAGGVAFAAGRGDGTFEAPVVFDLPGPTFAVAIGDIDLDGVPDVVAALGGETAVGVLLSRRGPWDDFDQPLAGSAGYADQDAEGTLQGLALFAFTLRDAPPGAAAFHVVGLAELSFPFKGGVLVPTPDLLNGPLFVGPSGELTLAGPWIPGLPSGLPLYLQFWWADAGGPKGFAASRAVRGTMP